MIYNTGADILPIITESLYDNPIVVFREYVQNSVDAFLAALKQEKNILKDDLYCDILCQNGNLIFLDNGTGIKREEFYKKMVSIGMSGKDRVHDIGYKGIGRLSGISYCKKLFLVNIIDYDNNDVDAVYFDIEKYTKLKSEGKTSDMSFDDLMSEICIQCKEVLSADSFIKSILDSAREMFAKRKTGFLVIMEQINSLLKERCDDKNIFEDLGWLLPVPFKGDIVRENSEMFDDMFSDVGGIEKALPMFKILYNGEQILRPINKDNMRDYVAERKLGNSAVSFITFRKYKFQIENDRFSGLKLYIDNMLLCDEMEIVQYLVQNHFIDMTTRECVQALRGVAGMIYVKDKIDIKANARRTFIDMADEGAVPFLLQLSDYAQKINRARYALSTYSRLKKVVDKENKEKNEQLDLCRKRANDSLKDLVEINVDLLEEEKNSYQTLSESEKKNVLKKILQDFLREKLREFLKFIEVSTYDRNKVCSEFVDFIKDKI